MSTLSSQPTVLVKKSDGSFARMTLDEVNQMRGKQRDDTKIPASAGMAVEDKIAASAQTTSGTEILKQVQNDNIKKGTVSSASKTVPAPASKTAPRNDNKPPDVFTPVPVPKLGFTAAPAAQFSRVDAIIAKLSFRVPPEFINRLRSLIQLRLKDVRDDRQTKETAMRQLKEGGLGLNEAQADDLVKKCELTARFAEDNTPKVSVISSSIPRPASFAPRAAVVSTFKPAVQDVIIKPAQMSPVDELKYFTLIDFRRLSSDPKEAASRLKQKFTNLKEESYLLFVEALEKWRQSPLFAAYMSLVEGALLNRGRLSSPPEKEKIQLPEIYAIIEMERNLI